MPAATYDQAMGEHEGSSAPSGVRPASAEFGGGRPASLRVDYDGDGLTEGRLPARPCGGGGAWVDAAGARAEGSRDVFEPLAISVATVDGDGRPNVRTVLM